MGANCWIKRTKTPSSITITADLITSIDLQWCFIRWCEHARLTGPLNVKELGRGVRLTSKLQCLMVFCTTSTATGYSQNSGSKYDIKAMWRLISNSLIFMLALLRLYGSPSGKNVCGPFSRKKVTLQVREDEDHHHTQTLYLWQRERERELSRSLKLKCWWEEGEVLLTG